MLGELGAKGLDQALGMPEGLVLPELWVPWRFGLGGQAPQYIQDWASGDSAAVLGHSGASAWALGSQQGPGLAICLLGPPALQAAPHPGFAPTQVVLINAVKDVAKALGDLISATKAAAGKAGDDPAVYQLKNSAKVRAGEMSLGGEGGSRLPGASGEGEAGAWWVLGLHVPWG